MPIKASLTTPKLIHWQKNYLDDLRFSNVLDVIPEKTFKKKNSLLSLLINKFRTFRK